MILELVNAAACLATLVLLTITAIAGFVQLRHLRAGNELTATLAIERDFRTAEVQAALRYVQAELPRQLERSEFRLELCAPGYIDPKRHPEMTLCNWFNRTGALVRGGFLNEGAFLDSFGRLIVHYWKLLSPVVAILRRTRGPDQYAGFEFLAERAHQQLARSGNSRTAATVPLGDPWLAADTE